MGKNIICHLEHFPILTRDIYCQFLKHYVSHFSRPQDLNYKCEVMSSRRAIEIVFKNKTKHTNSFINLLFVP